MNTPVLPDYKVTISTYSLCSMGGAPGSWGVPASGAWPIANRAFYVPFRISQPMLVKLMFVFNGGFVAGNLDIGIYDAVGTRLVSSGAVAQAGINSIQTVDIVDTLLGSGMFYMALSLSGAGAATFRCVPTATYLRAMGVQQEDGALPLPATATFAAMASSVLSVFGLSARTVV